MTEEYKRLENMDEIEEPSEEELNEVDSRIDEIRSLKPEDFQKWYNECRIDYASELGEESIEIYLHGGPFAENQEFDRDMSIKFVKFLSYPEVDVSKREYEYEQYVWVGGKCSWLGESDIDMWRESLIHLCSRI